MNNKAENHYKYPYLNIHPYLSEKTAFDFKLDQDSKISLRNELHSFLLLKSFEDGLVLSIPKQNTL